MAGDSNRNSEEQVTTCTILAGAIHDGWVDSPKQYNGKKTYNFTLFRMKFGSRAQQSTIIWHTIWQYDYRFCRKHHRNRSLQPTQSPYSRGSLNLMFFAIFYENDLFFLIAIVILQKWVSVGSSWEVIERFPDFRPGIWHGLCLGALPWAFRSWRSRDWSRPCCRRAKSDSLISVQLCIPKPFLICGIASVCSRPLREFVQSSIPLVAARFCFV